MKKLCCVFFVCLFLFGCTAEIDIKKKLDEVIDNTSKLENVNRQDHTSTYYSYYLPSDFYQLLASQDAEVFSFNNEKVLMNLNIPSIIALKKEDVEGKLNAESFYSNDDLVYSKSGDFLDIDNHQCNYIFEVFKSNGKYLVAFKTDVMNYYAYSGEGNLPLLTKRLFEIAKSLSVSRDNVIANYSNVDIIDYRREQVNLFETLIPKEGHLEDIIIDKEIDDIPTNFDEELNENEIESEE